MEVKDYLYIEVDMTFEQNRQGKCCWSSRGLLKLGHMEVHEDKKHGEEEESILKHAKGICS